MSGIAELLVNIGFRVSGSDLRRSVITDRLETLGVQIREGHDAMYVGDADLVVVSTAVPLDNVECVAAGRAGIQIISRGDMLAQLADLKRTVAVVGSHGKTTTTAMITFALEFAGLDPTAIIGGRVSAFKSNARLGQGSVMVVEADESDRSFLRLSPEIAVLTNIDAEHLDAYDGMDDLVHAFSLFAGQVAKTGCVIACGDDARLRRVVQDVDGRVVIYGVDGESAHIRAYDVALSPIASSCMVRVVTETVTAKVNLRLAVPGRHNVHNALAALAVGVQLGLSAEVIAEGLSRFTGADRRFQVVGDVNGVVVVDDYGHHPTEIEAVIATARLRSPERLRIVFQPHRYSRTRRLLTEFGNALAAADDVIVTDVYGAGEIPLQGATAEAVADAVRRVSPISVQVVNSLDDVPGIVAADARPGDVVVTLGAGSIGSVARSIVEALRRRRSPERPV